MVLAYFVKSITGFGNTLVMGSLFSYIVPNKLTTPVDLLMSIPTNGYMTWRERKHISLKAAVPLAVLMIIGIIPGVYFLKLGSDRVIKAVLGLVIIGTAIQIGIGKSGLQAKKSNPAVLIIIGFISGILAGVFGIGVFVAVYFTKTAVNKHQFRANTCFVFFVENLFRLILYCVTGILNKNVFLMTLALSPAVLIGMVLGIKADKRINEAKLKYIVVIMLILSGVTLFVKNMFF